MFKYLKIYIFVKAAFVSRKVEKLMDLGLFPALKAYLGLFPALKAYLGLSPALKAYLGLSPLKAYSGQVKVEISSKILARCDQLKLGGGGGILTP